jgi:hypothetical protein
MKTYTVAQLPKQKAWKLVRRDWDKGRLITLAYFGEREMAARAKARLNCKEEARFNVG